MHQRTRWQLAPAADCALLYLDEEQCVAGMMAHGPFVHQGKAAGNAGLLAVALEPYQGKACEKGEEAGQVQGQ